MIDLNVIDAAPVRFDLDEIVRRLRATAETWVPGMFPNGRREGHQWRLANIHGDPPRKSGSCVIELRGDRAGDWHDFDGDQGGGPLSTLSHGVHLSDRPLFAYAADMVGWSPAAPARQGPPVAATKPERDSSREVVFILEHALPVADTSVEAYLTGRGLTVPAGADLQFHPDLTHWETKTGYPGMIGVVRDVAGAVIALHRTYLSDDPVQPGVVQKATVTKPRMMLGRTGGGTVRLGPIGPAGVLGLCEGIETGLAVMNACPGLPVWAALSTSGIEQALLPPEARCIVLLADHDASGAGLRAAEAAAAKLRFDGRDVSIALPPRRGDDFNDMLRRDGADVIAALVDASMRKKPEPPAPPRDQTGRHLPIGFVEPKAPLPVARADEGNLNFATMRAWSLLLAANRPPWLYRLGTLPSWVVPDDDGLPSAVTVREERLRHMLAKIADWRRLTAKGELAPTHPPVALVKSMVATPDPALPVLAGIVTAPVFGQGGVLLTEPGYHPDARLLYQPPPGFVLEPIPRTPSASEIAAARSLLLDDLLGDFPFVGAAERAHALVLLLLGFIRAMIDGPTPLHMIEKPTPGTGATLMVDAITTVLTGFGAPVMTEGRDEDEWRKRLTAKLRQLPTLLLIDNLRNELDSSALAAALTAPIWEDRVLGGSDMVRLPIRCVWVATGNNPTFSNEMARRLVRIRLDAHVDQPWRRETFRHPNLMGWVRANRGKLVAACLTLCQAWVAAGRPRGSRRLGGFEHWAETLGGVLDVAGITGFLGNIDEMIEASDTEGAAWRGFVQSWWERFGTAEVGVASLFDMAIKAEPPIDVGDGSERSQRTRFGTSLRRMRDRVFQLPYRKVRVEAGRIVHQARQWQLAIEVDPEGREGVARPTTDGNHSTARGTRVADVPFETSLSDTGKWEPGELGEPSITLTHARTHTRAHDKKNTGSGSQTSQGSQDQVQHSEFAGESIGGPPDDGSHILPPPSWLEGVP